MILDNGTQTLWQWNTGQKLVMQDWEIGEQISSVSMSVDGINAVLKQVEGKYIEIPDVLLQSAGDLTIYLHRGSDAHLTTVTTLSFPIAEQPKPDDYVAREELLSWHRMEQMVQENSRKVDTAVAAAARSEQMAQAAQNALTEFSGMHLYSMELLASDFLKGIVNISTGSTKPEERRCMIRQNFPCPVIVECAPDVKVSARYYGPNGYEGYEDWQTGQKITFCGNQTDPAGTDTQRDRTVRIAVSYVDDRAVTGEAFQDLAGKIRIWSSASERELEQIRFYARNQILGFHELDGPGQDMPNSHSAVSNLIRIPGEVGDTLTLRLQPDYFVKCVFYENGEPISIPVAGPFTEVPVQSEFLRLEVRCMDRHLTLKEVRHAVEIVSIQKTEEVPHGANCLNPEAAAAGYGLDEFGALTERPEGIVSEYIRVPRKNPECDPMLDPFSKLVACAVQNAKFGFAARTVAWYDRKYRFLDRAATCSGAIAVPEAAAYVRVEFGAADRMLYVGFSRKTAVPTYESYRIRAGGCVFDQIHNSDAAVTAMLETAMEYAYHETFGYGNTHTAFHKDCGKVRSDGSYFEPGKPLYEGERYQMDCSSFVSLALQGITLKNSRYLGTDNRPGLFGYHFDGLAEYVTEEGRMMAGALAKYAADHGYLMELMPDLSNAEPGDVIFTGNQPEQLHSFRNIGHCALVTDCRPAESGDGCCTVLEAKSTGEYAVQSNRIKQSPEVCCIARFPLKAGSTETVNLCTNSESGTTALTGAEQTVVPLRKLALSEKLCIGKVYTLVMDADLPAASLQITVNDGKTIVASSEWKPDADRDGQFCIPILLHRNLMLEKPQQIELSVQKADGVDRQAVIRSVKLLRGFRRMQ